MFDKIKFSELKINDVFEDTSPEHRFCIRVQDYEDSNTKFNSVYLDTGEIFYFSSEDYVRLRNDLQNII